MEVEIFKWEKSVQGISRKHLAMFHSRIVLYSTLTVQKHSDLLSRDQSKIIFMVSLSCQCYIQIWLYLLNSIKKKQKT